MTTPTTALDWNRAYRTGDHHKYWELSHPSADLVGFLAARGPGEGRTALDIGCGTGWDSLALAGAGYRVTGADISEEALALARARAEQERPGDGEISFCRADIRELPFPDASFDLLVDRGCFHHLGQDDQARYAHEAARVLRRKGTLYLRGSRADIFPFKPVTAEGLRHHFAPLGFDIGPLLPFQLQTDAMSLPSHTCVLTRSAAAPA
jgi:ubiquinone/menaquinone biosynthesis C-methylase UbiE